MTAGMYPAFFPASEDEVQITDTMYISPLTRETNWERQNIATTRL